jgi:YggT family protein
LAYVLQFIQIFLEVLSWLVILHAILSYFVDPANPIRSGINQMVEPMLAPIRAIVPTVGMFDLSPLVLLIVIQVVGFAVGSIRL